MNVITNRFLANFFLDADTIRVSPRDINELLLILEDKELIPTTATEQDSNIPRMRFNTADGEWEVLLLSKSFFVRQNAVTPTGDNLEDFTEFCDEAGDILISILEYFDRKVHRLALVRRDIVHEIRGPQFHEIRERFLVTPINSLDDEPFEWDWRRANRVFRQFGEIEEPTNEVITVQRREIKIQTKQDDQVDELSFDGLIVDLDINTVPSNVRSRFGAEEIRAFIENATIWHNELRDSIIHQIMGENNG